MYRILGGNGDRAGRVPFTTQAGLSLKQALEHKWVIRSRRSFTETTCYWLLESYIPHLHDDDLVWQDMWVQRCRSSALLNRLLTVRHDWSRK